jgi:hypothetical protein
LSSRHDLGFRQKCDIPLRQGPIRGFHHAGPNTAGYQHHVSMPAVGSAMQSMLPCLLDTKWWRGWGWGRSTTTALPPPQHAPQPQ